MSNTDILLSRPRVLVVGFGSAGQRHAKNAMMLGYHVEVVTSSDISEYHYYHTLNAALSDGEHQFVIIASPTHRHADELKECIAHNIPCLVEKPLMTNFNEFQSTVKNLPPNNKYAVAYLLRYHPMIKKLKDDLQSLGRLYDASMVFGQYLPWWRPNTDYEKCYSAFIDQGGGVLLDSSHEIDLIHYLFGDISSLVAVSDKTSTLNIESDDIGVVIFKMVSGQVVQLNLNYLNQIPERRIVINGEYGSINVDLMNANYRSYINDCRQEELYSIDRNQLFVDELVDFIEKPEQCLLPNLNQSMVTLKIVDAIRQSSLEQKWITLKK